MPRSDEDDSVDSAVAAALTGGRDEDWLALWDPADALAEPTAFATWVCGDVVGTRVVEGEVKNVCRMRYAQYAEPVLRVRERLGALGLFVPFGWMDWDGTRRYQDDPESMADAPVSDAVRMLVAIHRSERFAGGSIESALRGGVMQAALARLRRWYDCER